MILRGFEGHRCRSIAQGNEADFFPFEKLFDYERAGKASDGGHGFLSRPRNDHSLAGGQTIGFQNYRNTETGEYRCGFGRCGHGLKPCRRDSQALHELLREDLAALQAGIRSGRPHDGHIAGAKAIDDTLDQRSFRANNREIDIQLFREFQIVGSRSDSGHLCDSRIARNCDELCHGGGLSQTPGERVFAPAGADNEDFQAVLPDTMVSMVSEFDIVVVGGGHAGCEAARACARMGLRTCMITMNVDLIAQMSCNPAIGGIAKGHLVREIDALGGVMGEVADAVGIQFRLLNTSRGPAVWSPRAQCDKKQYRIRMKQVLETEENLSIKQAEVAALVIESGVVRGVRLTDGRTLRCGAVIITTGTFLKGLAHIGERKLPCGRSGEAASEVLAEQIRGLNLGWTRLKTGTPPRLDGRTIDWSKFEPQAGDTNPTPFSFMTEKIERPQIECFMARTTADTRDAVLESISRSPLYSGQIEGIGPRYCPSIEDKFVKFPDKESHQLFLEPEGVDTHEIYVNGMSTSMPIDVQIRMIASISGLEKAEMIRPGYAIEYDAVDARELDHSLEVRKLPGLFLAGQINGTSGYEEAAGQGLMAGINAARKFQGRERVVLGRADAYIGIMIDDLITRGTDEPYRMFTSRAEHRLHLRIDNADRRLTPTGQRVGLVRDERTRFFEAKRSQVDQLLVAFESSPRAARLRRPETGIGEFREWIASVLSCEPLRGVLMTAETEVKYSGYLDQQKRQVERMRTSDGRRIPVEMNFRCIPGLSREVGEKLEKVRPATLGQAARIPGVTPAAVGILDIYLSLGVSTAAMK